MHFWVCIVVYLIPPSFSTNSQQITQSYNTNIFKTLYYSLYNNRMPIKGEKMNEMPLLDQTKLTAMNLWILTQQIVMLSLSFELGSRDWCSKGLINPYTKTWDSILRLFKMNFHKTFRPFSNSHDSSHEPTCKCGNSGGSPLMRFAHKFASVRK